MLYDEEEEVEEKKDIVLRPATVVAYYVSKGIKYDSIRPFQEFIFKCFQEKSRMLLVMPTGYGKTMIADFAAQYYLSRGKKVLFCVPFLALMNEQFITSKQKWPAFRDRKYYKCKQFERGALSNSIRNADLIFCTFERAKGIVAKAAKISPKKGSVLDEVGLIILDEVHMINDKQRGVSVDWLIVMAKIRGIPMIGMTGTLEPDGAMKLAEYMKADLFFTKKRGNNLPIRFFFTIDDIFKIRRSDDQPIYKLTYYLDGKLIRDSNGNEVKRDIFNNINEVMSFKDTSKKSLYPNPFTQYIPKCYNEKGELRYIGNNAHYLASIIQVEVNKEFPEDSRLPEGDPRRKRYKNGVLVYSTYKYILENYITPKDPNDTDESPRFPIISVGACSIDILKRRREYMNAPGISEWNQRLIPLGMAIHTADIPTKAERDLIVKLFEEKVIRVIFCTSTLSAGINLSNLTLVIVASTWRRDGIQISMNELIQTCGRAGRSPGFPGEAWIFYSYRDALRMRDYELHLEDYVTQEEDNEREIDLKDDDNENILESKGQDISNQQEPVFSSNDTNPFGGSITNGYDFTGRTLDPERKLSLIACNSMNYKSDFEENPGDLFNAISEQVFKNRNRTYEEIEKRTKKPLNVLQIRNGYLSMESSCWIDISLSTMMENNRVRAIMDSRMIEQLKSTTDPSQRAAILGKLTEYELKSEYYKCKRLVENEYLISFIMHCAPTIINSIKCEATVLPLTRVQDTILTSILEMNHYFEVPIVDVINELNYAGRLNSEGMINLLKAKGLVIGGGDFLVLSQLGLLVASSGLTEREARVLDRRIKLFGEVLYPRVSSIQNIKLKNMANDVIALWLTCMYMFSSASKVCNILSLSFTNKSIDEAVESFVKGEKYDGNMDVPNENQLKKDTLRRFREDTDELFYAIVKILDIDGFALDESSLDAMGLANSHNKVNASVLDELNEKHKHPDLHSNSNPILGRAQETQKLHDKEDFIWNYRYDAATIDRYSTNHTDSTEKPLLEDTKTKNDRLIGLFFTASCSINQYRRRKKDREVRALFIILWNLYFVNNGNGIPNVPKEILDNNELLTDIKEDLSNYSTVILSALENLKKGEEDTSPIRLLFNIYEPFNKKLKLFLDPLIDQMLNILKGVLKDRAIAKRIKTWCRAANNKGELTINIISIYIVNRQDFILKQLTQGRNKSQEEIESIITSMKDTVESIKINRKFK